MIIAKQRIYISLILNYCNQDFYIIIFAVLFVKTRRGNSMHTIIITICFVFVLVEVLRPSQQVFSHVGKEPLLPGYYQYFCGVNVSCSRIQNCDPTEDRTPDLSLWSPTLYH